MNLAGSKTRIGIARALSKPRICSLDEATSALDVSIQAQVLKFVNESEEEEI